MSNSPFRPKKKNTHLLPVGLSASAHSVRKKVPPKYEESVLTLGEHLEELRSHLIWALIVIIFICSITLGASNFLHNILITPYTKLTQQKLLLQNVYGSLEVLAKIGINMGLILALPICLSILWNFAVPALSRKVAFLGHLCVAVSAILFWIGVLVAWYYLIPLSLGFLFQDFMIDGVSPQTTVEKYYSFLFLLFIGCGLVFQLPMLTIALGFLGILNFNWHKKYWRYIILVTFIFSAIITPPEPISQIILSSMLLILYSIAVSIVWLIEKTSKKKNNLATQFK